MIKVDKNMAVKPSGLVSKTALTKVRQILDHPHAISDLYKHRTVREELFRIYRRKCAYCECAVSHGSFLEVDHFRPKQKVIQDPNHTGYFWLAYEWSNLLLSCQICNNSKSYHFPILGQRLTGPPTRRSDWQVNSSPMLAERPLLINPEIDQPENYLKFSPSGEISPRNNSQKGRVTIVTCKLNRDHLTLARKAKRDRILARFRNRLIRLLEKNRKNLSIKNKNQYHRVLKDAFFGDFIDLQALANPEEEFSAFGSYIFEQFEIVFLSALPAGEPRKILEAAMLLYRRKNKEE